MARKLSNFDRPIGIFNETFPPLMDGVSLTVFNYAYWIQQKGIPVKVITPNMPQSTDDDAFEVVRYRSFPILVRKPYRMGMPYADFSFMNKELFKSHANYSIIHAHSPFSSGYLARSISRKQNIPFVATFHSKLRDDFRRLFKNKIVVDIIIKNIIKFYESADEVWLPQASVEETIREYGYKGKVEIVDNGTDFLDNINIEEFKEQSRKTLNIKSEEAVLLFVGQHIWEKNTKMILEALNQIRNFPYRMFFVGNGYAMQEMKAFVTHHNLQDKITFTGNIYDRNTLKEYYAAADIFLFPSIYDNAPLVVREASALHTPSILVKGSTCAEVVTDNVNGYLIENTVDALSSKIIEVLANPQKLKIVGENASNTISRSWREVTEEVLDRYNHLILRYGQK